MKIKSINASAKRETCALFITAETAELLQEYRLFEEKMSTKSNKFFDGDILGVDPETNFTSVVFIKSYACYRTAWL